MLENADLARGLFAPSARPAVDFGHLARSYYLATSESLVAGALAAGLQFDPDALRLEPGLLDRNGPRCWLPELGLAFQLSRQGGRQVEASLAQLALGNARLGADSNLRFSTTRGGYFLFAGCVIPSANEIAIESGGGHVRITAADFDLEFALEESAWICVNHELWRLPSAALPGVIVTGGNCVDPEMVFFSDPAADPAEFEVAAQNIDAGAEVIRIHSPVYHNWCADVLRQVHVVGKTTTRTLSRSAPCRPGSVVATSPMDAVAQAEMLVHECTHQYYYLLGLITGLTRPEAEGRSFYSPLIGRKRSIDRCLMAYHALANMVALHHTLIDAGINSDTPAKRLETLVPICAETRSTLLENRNLLQPLAAEFFEYSVDWLADMDPAFAPSPRIPVHA
jgi:HEXXH motif-containing protein